MNAGRTEYVQNYANAFIIAYNATKESSQFPNYLVFC